MSIRVMTTIWDSELYKGGTLLVLLAMADFADDKGGSIFPTIDTLAKKARLSPRQVSTAIKEMREDGVLQIVKQATGRPGQATSYRIDLERVKKLHPSPEAETGAVSDMDGCSLQHGGVKSATTGVKNPASHIDNHQEPSGTVIEPPEASPPLVVPQADLLGEVPVKAQTPAETLASAYAAYAETAERARWPAVSKQTSARDAHLRARLKDAGGLEGWRAALAKAEASDFCCGRSPPTPPRTKAFLADFDFLTNESSFVKLMEGKYDNREGTKPRGGGGFLEAAARRAAGRVAADP